VEVKKEKGNAKTQNLLLTLGKSAQKLIGMSELKFKALKFECQETSYHYIILAYHMRHGRCR
jgi:hypothetical protein